MARVQHPQPQVGIVTDRLGGIEFTDGVAEVDLTDKPNLREAYAQHGYTVEDGTPFFDLTVPQLRELAKNEDIALPKNATKAEIVRAFLDASIDEA
ncbi:hypothetical protein [Cryobacterium soli]|uniref:hypothetical protein n=1 Tax=Cryobacterium soli TaxID=2220095 RepID=UPI000E7538F9|nr:hypothetical protein [Cryobacterium soli]